jgi:hypothetical protein
MVEKTGLHCSLNNCKGPNKIVASGSLFRIFKKTSPDEFVNILTIIKNAWGGAEGSLRKEILEGVYIFYKTYKNEMDMQKAISQFSKVAPFIIVREGNVSTQGGSSRYARQLVNAYNESLRRGRLKDTL